MPNANYARRTSRGFTLLEMLILVALLALIAGLSWPSLRRLSLKRELLESARQVRVELQRTRLDAIESGAARQFRYQQGSGLFESSAFSPSDALQADDAWREDAELPLDSATEMEFAGEDAGSEDNETGLPTGVFFVDPASESTIDSVSQEAEDAPVWSAPILFYPNGRTLNARIELSNSDYTVDITLRGLTGTARIGQVRRLVDDSEELLEDVP